MVSKGVQHHCPHNIHPSHAHIHAAHQMLRQCTKKLKLFIMLLEF